MSGAKTVPTPLRGLQSDLAGLAHQAAQLAGEHRTLVVAGAAGALALLVSGGLGRPWSDGAPWLAAKVWSWCQLRVLTRASKKSCALRQR